MKPVTGEPVKPKVVLVGPPGAGKTTVGRLVANRLGVVFRDTDADIVVAAGKSIADLFIEDGEETFRALECDAVATALATCDGVLALGGGAILSEQTRAALRGHLVVYLRAELGTAVARVGLSTGRPLLMVNPRATLRHLLEQRQPLYQEVATAIVPTDGRTAEEVADEVLQVISAGAGDVPSSR